MTELKKRLIWKKKALGVVTSILRTRILFIAIFIVIVIEIPFPIYSDEKIPLLERAFFVHGIRPLGMGGAFVGVADDENALFYNPAGLTRLDSFHLGLPLLNLGVGIDGPTVEAVRDGVDFFLFPPERRNLFSDERLKNVIHTIANTQAQISLASEILSYVQRGYGVGSYLSGRGEVTVGEGDLVDNPNALDFDDEISFDLGYDLGAVVGFASRFGENDFLVSPAAGDSLKSLNLGLSIKGAYRTKIIGELRVLEGAGLALGIEKLETLRRSHVSGLAALELGLDLGGLYSWDRLIESDYGLLDTALVLRNFPLTLIFALEEPLRRTPLSFTTYLPMEATLGLAYYPPFSIPDWFEDFLIALDFEDILANYPLGTVESPTPDLWQSFILRSHFGAEVKLISKHLGLRAGNNGGYPSFGLGINLFFFNIDYAYTVLKDNSYLEISQQDLYRHLINLSLGWKG